VRGINRAARTNGLFDDADAACCALKRHNLAAITAKPKMFVVDLGRFLVSCGYARHFEPEDFAIAKVVKLLLAIRVGALANHWVLVN
jgi:hypothetical protein